MYSIGTCASLNVNGCCTLGGAACSPDSVCYCDITCYLFGDCCPDIENIGCFSSKLTCMYLFIVTLCLIIVTSYAQMYLYAILLLF